VVSDDINTRLARWSQRKAAARRGAALDETPGQPAETPAGQEAKAGDGAAPPTDEMPVLPPIEELTADSDYTVFFQKNVPEALKNAALRKLWHSDPIFGHLDGLDHYAEDFNLVDAPITLADTSYKVGKGFLDDFEEKLAELETPDADETGRQDYEPSASAHETEVTALSQNVAAGENPITAARHDDPDEPAGAPDGQAVDKAD
jgi:hypothetical protein